MSSDFSCNSLLSEFLHGKGAWSICIARSWLIDQLVVVESWWESQSCGLIRMKAILHSTTMTVASTESYSQSGAMQSRDLVQSDMLREWWRRLQPPQTSHFLSKPPNTITKSISNLCLASSAPCHLIHSVVRIALRLTTYYYARRYNYVPAAMCAGSASCPTPV
jgi:hypothetical protein